MALWLVELPVNSTGMTFADGVKVQLVEADDAATAKGLAAARVGNDSAWSHASVTEVTGPVATDFRGFTYRVQVSGAVNQKDVIDLSHVAGPGDQVDSVGNALVTLLNNTGVVSGASYDNGSNTLTVAATSDNLGDRTLVLSVIPKGARKPVPQLVGSVTHNGASNAPLLVTLVAPSSVPNVVRAL